MSFKLPGNILDYNKNKAIKNWHIEGNGGTGFTGAVVIPALAETATLLDTLCSLALNPPEALSRFLVLVVVNHREDTPLADKLDNLASLEQFQKAAVPDNLQFAWVNAASSGMELPNKSGGVGLARKIGLDLALTRLDYDRHDPILACLDADTLVRPDYLPTLLRHFKSPDSNSAVINFVHQKGVTPEANSAIMRYELFLRSYVLGLKTAGSMYGFHTVGSAMACRASAYVKISGMNSRTAGEDFYFLQQLAKTAGVDQVKGTVIYPSARASHRVPFGTGRSISKLLEGDAGAVLFYHTDCFHILGRFLKLISDHLAEGPNFLLTQAREISPQLVNYLDLAGFEDIWEKLSRNNKGKQALWSAFNGWFDGLKTMKLIHHLSAGSLQRREPDEVMPDLLEWAGLARIRGLENQLELLRSVQLGEDYEESAKMLSAVG
ncbi:MAG TPA: glycosyltransferase family 2 protein [Desulfuromonadaceae bacterium]|jgi:hypothetical protein